MAALAVALIAIGKRLPVGAIFALYVAGYSLARFFIEGLRIDQAYTFNGLRLNQYVALLIFSASCVVLVRLLRAKR